MQLGLDENGTAIHLIPGSDISTTLCGISTDNFTAASGPAHPRRAIRNLQLCINPCELCLDKVGDYSSEFGLIGWETESFGVESNRTHNDLAGNSVIRYCIAYAAFVVSTDLIDRRTNLFSKQTGIFAKAYDFPWTDAWSVSHILWGAIAAGMNIPYKWYLSLAVLNEVVVEQSLCRLSKRYPWIRYARECDSPLHMATDLLWGIGGYYGWKWVSDWNEMRK